MNGKFGLVLVIVAVLTGGLVAACAAPAPVPAPTPAPAPAPTITWNFQNMQVSHDILPMPQFAEFTARVAERTEGKFQIRVTIEGELGIKRDGFTEALSTGMIEACMFASSIGERTMPHMGIYHLPQLAVGFDEWLKLAEALAELDDAGMKKQAFQSLYPGSLYSGWTQELLSEKPIEDLGDLDGLKVRIWRSGDEKLIRALNGEPVYMSSSEVYMAIQRGVVSALITGPPVMLTAAMYEVATHFYPIALPGGLDIFTVNTEAYAALPDEYKTILREEAEIAIENIRKDLTGEVEKALAGLKEHGVKIHELTSGDREAWKAAARPLWDEWAEADPSNAQAMEIAKKALGLR